MDFSSGAKAEAFSYFRKHTLLRPSIVDKAAHVWSGFLIFFFGGLRSVSIDSELLLYESDYSCRGDVRGSFLEKT